MSRERLDARTQGRKIIDACTCSSSAMLCTDTARFDDPSLECFARTKDPHAGIARRQPFSFSELLELTQRGDELARRRHELPWVRIDKVARPRPKGRNETDCWWRRHDEYDKRRG